ncbi:hypothetical protein GCM10023188_25630 [Pontibacter saemangeumensis]|uniref:Uncharacterized protein n=1 Tax=Pontibacter saemangeumensis TaxID=1084525 RepID=A0ABP8LSZ2_9BACT
MKKLLFLLLLFPFLSYGQWSESFESTKDTALYDCWTFREAQIVDYANGYEGWMHLVKLSTTGGYIETPYMDFAQDSLFQSLYFQFYATGNDGKTAALSIDYINTEGEVVDGYFIYGEGSGSFGASTSAQNYTGRAKARIFVYAVNDSAQAIGIYVDEFQGFGLALSCEQAVLPVHLISFKAVGDQLLWVTAMEQNVERFAVENSTDGMNFREVGTVKAAGFSQGRRDYAWRYAKVGGTSYFRLRTIDRDGTYELSKVIAVSGREDIAFGPFTIGVTEEVRQLSVYDMQGRRLQEHRTPAAFPEVKRGVPLILQLVTDRRAYSQKVLYKD